MKLTSTAIPILQCQILLKTITECILSRQVNSSNVKMKRQSHMIMSQLASGQNLVSINIDDYSDEVEEEPKKYLETLDKKIEGLQFCFKFFDQDYLKF